MRVALPVAGESRFGIKYPTQAASLRGHTGYVFSNPIQTAVGHDHAAATFAATLVAT